MKNMTIATIALMIMLWAALPGLATAEGDDPGSSGSKRLSRCVLAVRGAGSFQANHVNVANGAVIEWFVTGQPIVIRAKAEPGWEFSHWTISGNPGGSSAESMVTARHGVHITACFEKTNPRR